MIRMIIPLSMLIFSAAIGQPFEYNFPQPIVLDSYVQINWEIIAGSTCEGMTVEHSTDSIEFSRIHEITGTCGSANFNIPYNFIHETPLINMNNYYRIRFGGLITSEIKTVLPLSEDVFVFPNPVINIVNFKLKESYSSSTILEIFDVKGELILSATFIGQSFELNSSHIQSGVYIYKIIRETYTYTGKFAKL